MTCLPAETELGLVQGRIGAARGLCAAVRAAAGWDWAGQITLVLIIGSDLQANLACMYVDWTAARGRMGVLGADGPLRNILPTNAYPISSDKHLNS
jgi:hypothetical protein